jgi:hypothetical protein
MHAQQHSDVENCNRAAAAASAAASGPTQKEQMEQRKRVQIRGKGKILNDWTQGAQVPSRIKVLKGHATDILQIEG